MCASRLNTASSSRQTSFFPPKQGDICIGNQRCVRLDSNDLTTAEFEETQQVIQPVILSQEASEKHDMVDLD